MFLRANDTNEVKVVDKIEDFAAVSDVISFTEE